MPGKELQYIRNINAGKENNQENDGRERKHNTGRATTRKMEATVESDHLLPLPYLGFVLIVYVHVSCKRLLFDYL